MKTNPRFDRMVRAPAARYGDPASREESFPAEAVLRDLAVADRAAAPLITARYAALRYWLLCGTGEASELVEQARESARAYLAAAGEGEEREILDALLDRPEPLAEAAPLLDRAAELAELARHPYSAGALREAPFRMAVYRLDFGTAATVAADIGARLRRAGHYRAARRWERAAAGLSARRDGTVPPSAS